MTILVRTAFIVLCSITAVHAQIYKWVDEKGNIQYTDQPPPPGVAAEGKRLNIKSAPASPPEGGNSRNPADERQEFFKRQQQKKEEEAKRQAESEENRKKCIDAQTQLRMYTDSPRLTIPDGAGGIMYVDEDLRQRKIADANQAIAKFCK